MCVEIQQGLIGRLVDCCGSGRPWGAATRRREEEEEEESKGTGSQGTSRVESESGIDRREAERTRGTTTAGKGSVERCSG